MSYLVLIVYLLLELITQLFEKISHFHAEHTGITTMYRIQSFIAIELLLGYFSPLSYYNQAIKLKMEESALNRLVVVT